MVDRNKADRGTDSRHFDFYPLEAMNLQMEDRR
jgi:hypothetical protein